MTWKQWLKLTMSCETIWPKLFWTRAQKNICCIVKVLWRFYICVWPFPKSQIWTWCPWKLWYLQIFLWAQVSVYEIKDYHSECRVGWTGQEGQAGFFGKILAQSAGMAVLEPGPSSGKSPQNKFRSTQVISNLKCMNEFLHLCSKSHISWILGLFFEKSTTEIQRSQEPGVFSIIIEQVDSPFFVSFLLISIGKFRQVFDKFLNYPPSQLLKE